MGQLRCHDRVRQGHNSHWLLQHRNLKTQFKTTVLIAVSATRGHLLASSVSPTQLTEALVLPSVIHNQVFTVAILCFLPGGWTWNKIPEELSVTEALCFCTS